MRKIIKVNYRSVFKYDDHQESIKYNGHGYLEEFDNKIVIRYQDKNNIKIELFDDEVRLYNGASVLRLVKNRDILNNYQTEYGVIDLRTRLISYENGNSVKVKYELYDGLSLLSQVYVIINYIILEN